MSEVVKRLQKVLEKGPGNNRTCFLCSASFVCYLLHVGLLLGLFFDPEVGGDMFLRNAGCLS
jgi:hypothetical protein